ncbi:MFS transporter, partial [Streptomyces sp. SID3343]|uniref:MFS transporter n=1 Tax=Streptomyces sp. SID3343 TaxID=2690260 RepID=UPI001368C5A5
MSESSNPTKPAEDTGGEDGEPPAAATWGALFRAPYLATAVVLAGGVALHAVNVYLATSLLPSVVADIGGLRFYAWNTTLFVFASVVASVFVPRLLERAGPRPAYAWSLGVFTLGTVACMLAPTVGLLLAGRTLQGVGGGFLVGLSYAMIRVSLPPELWTRAAALVSGMWGVGTLVGPAAGGAFAQIGQWRLAFAFLLPCAAGLALLLRGALPGAGPRS